MQMGCDTIVVNGKKTRIGYTVFAKNSDRDPNEAQQIVFYKGAGHREGERLKCTYIDIPQAKKTYSVLLSKPFWMWGAEMGINEMGLAIGNEAVFTKTPYGTEPGLIGMDILRLALERAANSKEAVDIITDLTENYGQSGNCGYSHPLYYHNSYLAADPKEAWVIETSGKSWVAKRVTEYYSISNCLTIDEEWELASNDLKNLKKSKPLVADFIYTKFSYGRERRNLTMEKLGSMESIGINDIFKLLRTHTSKPLNRGITGASVCMHAGWGPIRISQTVGSMVCILSPERPEASTVFVTGTAAPCTSIYKPIWIDSLEAGQNSDLNYGDINYETLHSLFDTLKPGKLFERNKLFWKHELIHRLSMKNPEKIMPLYTVNRDRLENELIDESIKIAKNDAKERLQFIINSFSRADDFEDETLKNILDKISNKNIKDTRGFLYRLAWKRFNSRVGIVSI